MKYNKLLWIELDIGKDSPLEDSHIASINIFKVAEVDKAALQCPTLCAYGGNFEHSISVH